MKGRLRCETTRIPVLQLGTELLIVTLETYTIATRSRKACETVLAAIATRKGELPNNDWSKALRWLWPEESGKKEDTH